MPTHQQPDPDLVALGRAILRLREQRAMSAGELAVATGIAPARLSALEAGEIDPTYDVLLTLADGLGVPLEQLVRLVRELGSRGAS